METNDTDLDVVYKNVLAEKGTTNKVEVLMNGLLHCLRQVENDPDQVRALVNDLENKIPVFFTAFTKRETLPEPPVKKSPGVWTPKKP